MKTSVRPQRIKKKFGTITKMLKLKMKKRNLKGAL